MTHSRVAANTLVIAACVAAAIAAAWPAEGQTPAAPPEETGAPAARTQWIGLPRSAVFKKLGRPSQVIEYPDTGGQLLIYSHSGQPHYVFETGPDSKVISAMETKKGK